MSDATRPVTAGPGIRHTLSEELERAELKVKLRAEVGLALTF